MSRPQDPIQRANAAYVEEQYRRWREDPTSVPQDWQWFFQGFEFAGAATAPPAGPATGGVFGLVTAYREFGHLIAKLDPLSEPPPSHPLLELSNFGLRSEERRVGKECRSHVE